MLNSWLKKLSNPCYQETIKCGKGLVMLWTVWQLEELDVCTSDGFEFFSKGMHLPIQLENYSRMVWGQP